MLKMSFPDFPGEKKAGNMILFYISNIEVPNINVYVDLRFFIMNITLQ